MKTLINSCVFMVIGIVVGWFSHVQFGGVPTAGTSLLSSSGDVRRWVSPAEDSNGGSRFLVTADARNDRVAPPVSEVSQQLMEFIRLQKTEQFVTTLQQTGVGVRGLPRVASEFFSNLSVLHQQGDWTTLSRWITKMLDAGYDDSTLYALDAKIKLHTQNRLAALEALFLAKYYSSTDEEIRAVQTDIENIVINMMNQYREKSTQVSGQVALPVMEFVFEKQPENPLFGLEIAILFADAGDLAKAIETLNVIPYSEIYQDSIVGLKTQWLNEQNSTELVTSAIPLDKNGTHYHVTAIVNQERSLNLMIDTGATTTALSREAIDYLKSVGVLNGKEGSVSINTANGAAEVDVYRINLFAIGEYVIEDFELLEIELDNSESFDGLLGMNFLSLFEFEIDQTNRQLFLTAKRSE